MVVVSHYDTELRACPICESSDGVVVAREGYFELCYCRCGMLYTRNPPTAENKRRHYEAEAKRCQGTRGKLGTAYYTLANQIKSIPLYSQSIREIVAHFPHGDVNVVDLGCSGGLFLLGLQTVEDAFNVDAPPRFQVRGVAFDPREKSDTERYVSCSTAMMEEAGEKLHNWADVVTMFNVLEHVNDLPQCLTTVRSMLREHGLLMIDVPNNLVVLWRARLLRRWPPLCIDEHINHFIPRGLDRLLKKEGFQRLSRLPGLVQGTTGFGTFSTWKQRFRWLVTMALFFITGKRLQIFPNLTVIYCKHHPSETKN